MRETREAQTGGIGEWEKHELAKLKQRAMDALVKEEDCEKEKRMRERERDGGRGGWEVEQPAVSQSE